ncbi:RecQ family ATP-dependent DNA helicase [Bacillus sp. FJAT-45350]|uniref:RecQ family ATP-dependent DNA helicase n=1 Tax=Bacillus sp. FJAT-45350 TaxID=2011014 RepID=UPI000BB83235|nr:ATP-dependent DNA helicase RecQ [Bacillus sp. FJAT-45350]
MNLEKQLFENFGHAQFRTGQKEIIIDVLKGKDVLAMLPTGTGKSICYQLPAILSKWSTVVVSPLLSLMEDQVQQLKSEGIKNVVAINSFLDYKERKYILENLSQYKIIYVSPEILQSLELVNALRKRKVSLFVVDEAHCISQWGYEFRTDYLKLADVRNELENPPCLALTATATKDIQADICNQLNLHEPSKHIQSVDRKNIALSVQRVNTTNDKIIAITDLIKKLQGPGMIYFSSRKWAEKIASHLLNEQVGRVAYYHGGLETEDRLLIQQQFLNNQLDIICCTSAFGMGINKKNVRFVVHFHFPIQVESYLQEIGRAGRDGKESVAIVFYSDEDRRLPDLLISQELPTETELVAVLEYLVTHEQEETVLTKNVEDMIVNVCSIKETTWRFIKYQLESFEVLINGKLKIRGKEKEITRVIYKIIENRLEMKQIKRNEMEKWLTTTDCRRAEALKLFSETLLDSQDICCDNCGFEIERFYRANDQVGQPKLGALSWSDQLKRILHQK